MNVSLVKSDHCSGLFASLKIRLSLLSTIVSRFLMLHSEMAGKGTTRGSTSIVTLKIRQDTIYLGPLSIKVQNARSMFKVTLHMN